MALRTQDSSLNAQDSSDQMQRDSHTEDFIGDHNRDLNLGSNAVAVEQHLSDSQNSDSLEYTRSLPGQPDLTAIDFTSDAVAPEQSAADTPRTITSHPGPVTNYTGSIDE